MLPDNQLSSTPITGPLVLPDGLVLDDLLDFETGGVALNDPSQGLQVQTWTCAYIDNSKVVIKALSTGYTAVLFERARITSVSLAFDQNMHPIVAYEIDGEVFLWWWDSLTSQRRDDSFGNVRCPRVTLDDKRAQQLANSDVIFAYIKGKNLCYRQQRDRFTVERVLRDGVSALSRLKNVAMSKGYRLQFELV